MRLKFAAFRCPCCQEPLVVDKAKIVADGDDLNITEVVVIGGEGTSASLEAWVASEEAARELESERQRIRDTKGFFP